MADAAPYLIALALVEQNGVRAMPLQGKSLREPLPPSGDPGEVGRQQTLELLVRVWQRSEEGVLRRAAGACSLLLAAVPIEALMEQVPRLKADWIHGGDTTALITELQRLSSGLWSVQMEPRQPLCFQPLPVKPA
jgi:hypothetical protein